MRMELVYLSSKLCPKTRPTPTVHLDVCQMIIALFHIYSDRRHRSPHSHGIRDVVGFAGPDRFDEREDRIFSPLVRVIPSSPGSRMQFQRTYNSCLCGRSYLTLICPTYHLGMARNDTFHQPHQRTAHRGWMKQNSLLTGISGLNFHHRITAQGHFTQKHSPQKSVQTPAQRMEGCSYHLPDSTEDSEPSRPHVW